MREIIYEMRDGSEERFALFTLEDEQHERAAADRELHSRDTQVIGYRIEEVTMPLRKALYNMSNTFSSKDRA